VQKYSRNFCLVPICHWQLSNLRPAQSRLIEFNVHGSVYRKNILTYVPQDAMLHSLFYLETTLHASGGTTTHHQQRKQLYLQHLVFHTITATCRYRGSVGTGVSVHSTQFQFYEYISCPQFAPKSCFSFIVITPVLWEMTPCR
jgi:hypothetical protein